MRGGCVAYVTTYRYRIGQTRRVRVVRLLVQGTIEGMVVGLQREKRSLAQAVLSAERLARMLQSD
eukprot:COSAG05_NODE_450_length_9731_cov_41.140201_1_plen_65_part_00